MNILIVPSWYTGYDNVEGNEGIFHYEQAAEMSREHNVAIYFPFDRAMPQNFSVEKERDILTFRSKYVRSQRIRNRIRIYKAFKEVFNKFKPDRAYACRYGSGKVCGAMVQLFSYPIYSDRTFYS